MLDTMSTSIFSLAGVASQSVSSVVACASLGAFAEWLHPDVLKGTNKLVSSIFLPCFIITQVIPSMSIENIRAIWPIAVQGLCMVLYGLISGGIIGICLERACPTFMPKYKGLIMAATAFPNALSVPLTLLLALGCHPILLQGHDMDKAAFQTRVSMLFLISYPLWLPGHWMVAFPMVSGAVTFADFRKNAVNPPLLACVLSVVAGLFLNSYGPEASTGYFSVWARYISLALGPISVALNYAGQCSVPLTIMGLGSKMYISVMNGKPKHQQLVDVEGGHSSLLHKDLPALPPVAYVLVAVVRQIIGPFLAVAIACGMLKRLCGVSDNLVLMVAMLQSAGPPMMDLNVMAGLSNSHEVETAVPKLLLLTYLVSIVTWPIAVTMFLHALQ